MFCPCRFSFRLFPLFLPPSAFRASTLIGPTHCTSNPVPIPYTPVLHFATKPQHSLSRVEKMSNFALVVPSSIEEGDRFPRVAPIDIHPSHRSKCHAHGHPNPPRRRPLYAPFRSPPAPCTVVFPRRQTAQSLLHHVSHHGCRSRPPLGHARLRAPPHEHRLSSASFLSRHRPLRRVVLSPLRPPTLPPLVG